MNIIIGADLVPTKSNIELFASVNNSIPIALYAEIHLVGAIRFGPHFFIGLHSSTNGTSKLKIL